MGSEDTKMRTPHRRRKSDPTRAPGALVISDEAKDALQNSDLFQGLERQQLMAVAALVEEHVVNANDNLITEGAPADYLYVIIEGTGVAQIETESGWMSLGLVRPGDTAGWSSLVSTNMYPATVKSLMPMRVARIATSGLKLLMNLEPEIGYPVHKSLSSIFYNQYHSAIKAVKTAGQ